MSTVPNPQPPANGLQLEDHPISQLFPLLGAKELDEMVESMRKSGQRDTIVLHEGKILDGRNRYRAALAAGLTPRTRVWGQYEGDGDSPTRFVLDCNLERRHLTAGQKGMVALEALPFFEAEAKQRQEAAGRGEAGPGAPGEAAQQAAATVGVSTSTVQRAKRVAKKSAKAAARVKAGEISLNAAEQEARQESAEATLDEATKELREQNSEQVHKVLGEEFGKAFDNGVVLKTADDLKDFLTLDAKDWKGIMPLVQRGWTVKKSLKFKNKTVTRRNTISELVLLVLCGGARKMKWVVDGHEIQIRMNVKDTSEGEGSTE